MDIETEYKINRLIIRLNRYSNFNWKVYFLKTFGLLFVLFLIMIFTMPGFFDGFDILTIVAINLWIMVLVCSILTPILHFYYRYRTEKVKKELDQLININNERAKETTIK